MINQQFDNHFTTNRELGIAPVIDTFIVPKFAISQSHAVYIVLISCTISDITVIQPRTKLLRHFDTIFNFVPCNHRVQQEQIRPPAYPLVPCCLGLTAQVCISCVTANNITIGEGKNGLLICDSKHFCQGECKKYVFL